MKEDVERAKFAGFHLDEMAKQLLKDWLEQPAASK